MYTHCWPDVVPGGLYYRYQVLLLKASSALHIGFWHYLYNKVVNQTAASVRGTTVTNNRNGQ
jgi:hypothetical protein